MLFLSYITKTLDCFVCSQRRWWTTIKPKGFNRRRLCEA